MLTGVNSMAQLRASTVQTGCSPSVNALAVFVLSTTLTRVLPSFPFSPVARKKTMPSRTWSVAASRRSSASHYLSSSMTFSVADRPRTTHPRNAGPDLPTLSPFPRIYPPPQPTLATPALTMRQWGPHRNPYHPPPTPSS